MLVLEVPIVRVATEVDVSRSPELREVKTLRRGEATKVDISRPLELREVEALR